MIKVKPEAEIVACLGAPVKLSLTPKLTTPDPVVVTWEVMKTHAADAEMVQLQKGEVVTAKLSSTPT
jgi:hypothetical protein